MAVERTIVLTKTPLKEAFALDGIFQLLPFKSERAPEIPSYARVYPCFLEYLMEDDESLEMDIKREREIVDALTAISQYRFYLEDIHRDEWCVPYPMFILDFGKFADDSVRTDDVKSTYGYPLFYYPEMNKDLICDSFSDLTNVPQMKCWMTFGYGGSTDLTRPDVKQQSKICFAPTIKDSLAAYFSTTGKIRKRLASIFHLVASGLSMGDFQDSVAFLAYVSAIEGMVKLDSIVNPKQISTEKCPECQRPFSSLGKDFRNFLNTYAAENEFEKEVIEKIYGQRCKIAHSGDIFQRDIPLLSESSEKEFEQNSLQYHTIALTRKSIANWLTRNKDKLTGGNDEF